MKTVIITGANGNLGQAVTHVFLQKGYQVIATIMDEKMKADLKEHPLLDIRVVDLTLEKETEDFVQQVILHYGKIEAALMLVGGFAMGNISACSGSAIDQQFSLNFKTAYHLARPLFSNMMGTGNGRLVFIGARPAIEPDQGKELIAYGLSKSLLFTLAEFLNAAAKGTNICAAVVVPSTLDTPSNRKSMPDTDPGSWVKPADMAEILEFMVSAKASPIRESVVKIYNRS